MNRARRDARAERAAAALRASKTHRRARAERAAAASTASNHVVNLMPSIIFDLVSCHIADYNAVSNCKFVHTYQTNMCSHLAPGYKNYPLKNYFTVPLLITHKTCLTYVCTQILLLPLTLVFSILCIRVLEAPGLLKLVLF